MESTDLFTSIPKLDYTETPPPIQTEEFRKVVMSRRSVRVFDGTPIPETVMRDCLDLALLAPNSSNLQPWEFYWVRNQEIKSKLITFCFSQPTARTAAELIVCVGRTDTWRRNSLEMLRVFKESGKEVPASAVAYYKTLVPLIYRQGIFGILGFIKKIAFGIRGLFTPSPREPQSHADMQLWAAKTTALAANTIMLALRAHGFDSCAMEGFDSVRVRRLLKLPRSANIVMVISAGKRASNGVYGPRIRFDRSLFIKEI